MDKVMVGKMPPSGFSTVIVGAMVNGKPNYNTLGCFGLIRRDPPVVYINSIKPHFTNIGIRETGYYSVNIPSGNIARETDYVGLVSGKDADKSKVFKPFFGSTDKAPMIEECPVNILCKVIHTVDLPDLPAADIFLGEVVEVYVNKDCMTDGRPDLSKIKPLLLSCGMYWEMTGKPAGQAYSAGKALIQKTIAQH